MDDLEAEAAAADAEPVGVVVPLAAVDDAADTEAAEVELAFAKVSASELHAKVVLELEQAEPSVLLAPLTKLTAAHCK